MAEMDDIEMNMDGTEDARLRAKEKELSEKMQNITRERRPVLTQEQTRVYREALKTLDEHGVKFAVGAAFARWVYTSIWRQTKDLDIFVTPNNLKPAMDALEQAGFQTEVKERNWLAKAWKDGCFLDLIFGTGHGQMPIDDQSFEGVLQERILGRLVHLMPIEEMIASAAYVAGRNRFDGPEVVHLIHSVKGKLDWQRIITRLGDNRELLLWHLILFDFVYPGHASYLPHELMDQLYEESRVRRISVKRSTKSFRGTLLDPYSYTVDVTDRGYEDRRNKDPLVDKKGKAL